MNSMKPSSGSGVPYSPMSYSGEEPLWPAVMHAAIEGEFYCEDTNLNVLADDYKFERCAAKGSDRIRFNTKIKRDGDEVGVEMQPEWYDSGTDAWKPGLPPLASADIDGARAQVIENMKSALSNKETYNRVKSNFYEDLSFHISVMEDMTSVGKKAWIKRLSESETRFTSEASLGDVNEVEKNDPRAGQFAYRAFLILNKPEDSPFVLFNDSLILYTNDEQLVARQKGDRVKFDGVVVDYLDGTVNQSFIMEQ
jgi:hypothetical protein